MDWSKLTQQVSTIKVKNVVDMPLFYGLFILAFALISSVLSKYAWVTVVLFSFAGLLFALAIFGYIYFTFKNPDYLRSEQYHLRKQSLEILGDKDKLLPIDANNIVQITNPHPNNLEEGNFETLTD
jgi:vacuolar-type H+-ATPase subunit I/STV1